MAILKVALLLLLGIILLVSNVEHTNAKACTKQCDPRIAFGICPHLQTKRINQICTNCCAGKKGCKKGCHYFSADGTFICEGESEFVSEVDNNLGKPCP
ncbi:proteinase inhibitor type-2 TR8-like isoform X2 [Solanum pennellii]|uniref:Proteinase inhibitor type-2 TR8-like isoform X2 n=1 Tax=Solanum pennellii TaxID=28526 RepID=A0ABM1UZJ9_SOLPN|nr:proteinase inhibitor type-2 TR8-like isoform X2 [Solanum pennellii]